MQTIKNLWPFSFDPMYTVGRTKRTKNRQIPKLEATDSKLVCRSVIDVAQIRGKDEL
jgi:hypothetical protein